jgi:type I restriction enzyme S subunit
MEHIESGTGVFLGIQDPVNVKSNTFRFDSRHVLYGRLRPYLNKVLSPTFEGHCSTEIFPLLPNPQLDREYLRHWLSSDEIVARINETCTGARMPRANMDAVSDFEVPVPPLPEQRRIVAILDEAFAAIATAKANTEKNLANARAVYESHLHAVFSQRDGEWAKQVPLEELTKEDSQITYGVVKPGEEGDVVFVRGGDLSRGRVLMHQLRTITSAFSQQYKRTLLRGGELLISLVGQPGQVAVAPPELAGANIARQVGLIRLRDSMEAEFVRLFLESPVGQALLGARQSGSVQQVINLGELRQVRVPVPSKPTQVQVVARLEAFSADTQRLEVLAHRKLAALDALRASLLHHAFTGQLTGSTKHRETANA